MKPQFKEFRSFIDEMKAVAAGTISPPKRKSRKVFASDEAYETYKKLNSRDRKRILKIDSISAVARLFTPQNQKLVALIAKGAVSSVADLARRTHRAEANLSRTLKKFEACGLVSLEPGQGKTKVPRLTMDCLLIQFDVSSGNVSVIDAKATDDKGWLCSSSDYLRERHQGRSKKTIEEGQPERPATQS